MNKYKLGDLFRVTNPHKDDWEAIAMIVSVTPYQVGSITIFDNRSIQDLGLRFNVDPITVEDPRNITEDEIKKAFDYPYEWELITENKTIEFIYKENNGQTAVT